ncbi:alkaline phosphatase family protein [Chitinophaga sp. SYP-B3965]|uniref:alkaline phosphatase PafA n=1 Tax=Chitinophaga sp. SYP-B3965 TaxID=2663120 RepID=UPI0012995417|nr:alkaline phosphatase PafA [Chitinophaga sp. SYP-B3965]MRG46181.1 alkaline phosphatase family protein [Chitinophaga sp. SYP-B3965]
MSRIKFLTVALLLTATVTFGQKATSPTHGFPPNYGNKTAKGIARPKLVVGMVVDQMRWDFLYRYYDRYSNDGFKRLLNEGFSCENTLIPYTPTITACGHTCAYTGSVPALHGIIGNNWYDRTTGQTMYCTEDTTVTAIGGSDAAGRMSPKNMLTNTITDELRLAQNFRNKTIGVAIKDRGAILPAGHSANAAYWYDGATGNFMTSSYYMNALPAWVDAFNNEKLPAKYLSQPWNTLYPVNTYTQSTADEKPYEGKFKGQNNTSFPHELAGTMGNSFGILSSTPFGNSFTLEFAKKALDNEQLGKGAFTDFLAVSLSSTDYVGHQHGPNSVETEDTYLRLDKDLAAFFKYLDQKVGKGQWLFFITADHGVAHVPGFLKENKLPTGFYSDAAMMKALNIGVETEFGIKKAIISADNYQFTLDIPGLEKSGKLEQVKDWIIKNAIRYPGVSNAVDLHQLATAPLPEPLKTMMINGFNVQRSGDIMITLLPGWLAGGNTGTTHGLWNPYDAHIPLVWMGWGVRHGKTNRTTAMTDIAPTVAAMLRIQMPNGNVGKVIEEVAH